MPADNDSFAEGFRFASLVFAAMGFDPAPDEINLLLRLVADGSITLLNPPAEIIANIERTSSQPLDDDLREVAHELGSGERRRRFDANSRAQAKIMLDRLQ